MSFNYVWRWCGTALSFFLFGAAGFVLWGLLFPLLEPFLGQGAAKKRRARRMMHRVFRCYIELMRGLGILAYEIEAGERLNRPGRLIVANHPTLLDIVFLIALTRNASCIVKPALLRNPFMRLPIRAMGYLYAEHPEELLEACAAELREGCSLIIFPEGTRSTPGQAIKFQRGAANIALKSEVKILPVHIDCSPSTLSKRDKWHQIPAKKFLIRLRVGEDIDPGGYGLGAPRSIAARKLTRHLEQYFMGLADKASH
jgi:1-acyl-sn-glycerol-3-phosphate acyltransferase